MMETKCAFNIERTHSKSALGEGGKEKEEETAGEKKSSTGGASANTANKVSASALQCHTTTFFNLVYPLQRTR